MKKVNILILFSLLSVACFSQSKKPAPKNSKIPTAKLPSFVKDLNKNLLTDEAIKKQSPEKPLYKTLFVTYKDGKTIVSPVKNGL
jgi:hypothetical protein